MYIYKNKSGANREEKYSHSRVDEIHLGLKREMVLSVPISSRLVFNLMCIDTKKRFYKITISAITSTGEEINL